VFREITDKRIRRGVFKSVKELVNAIMNYIQHHNDNPLAFHRAAKAEDILAKISRAHSVLNGKPTA